MITQYKIILTDGTVGDHEVDWPHDPGYDLIRSVVEPALGGATMEHVTVLHDGQRADMFVDEHSANKRLAVNTAASGIYHAATLARRPNADTRTLPLIYGTAVIFRRRVWF